MFSLTIDNVKPGMILAESVFNLEGAKLVGKDIALDDKLINRLRRAGIKRLWVTDDGNSLLVSETPQRIYGELVKLLHHIRQKVLAGSDFDMAYVYEVCRELIDQLFIDARPFTEMVRLKLVEASPAEHMVDVCLLSIASAKDMGMDRLDLKYLATAALLHDLGKFLVPENILSKPGPLTESEQRIIMKHPIMGHDLLYNMDKVNKLTLAVVSQHHERLDGTGYPYRLSGNLVHPYARLVAIADVYSALIREKSYRARFACYEAAEIIWAQAGSKLDKNSAIMFMSGVVAYPIRSTVRLNTGEIGQVIFQNKDFPTRPIVRVDQELIDLSESFTVFVEDLVSLEGE